MCNKMNRGSVCACVFLKMINEQKNDSVCLRICSTSAKGGRDCGNSAGRKMQFLSSPELIKPGVLPTQVVKHSQTIGKKTNKKKNLLCAPLT